VADDNLHDAEGFMETIESAWKEYDDETTSFIYTDLVVTIMELPKLHREELKSMMGTETTANYIRLLEIYREREA
jgi:hypothetical protein